MIYHGFASKLRHEVPSWVEPGAIFHIRIAVDRKRPQPGLTSAKRAPVLLDSARFYESKQRWHITLFLLMPDHIHALLSFPVQESFSNVIGDWKHFHARKHRVLWQEGFFDHRLRDDERGEQLGMKITYIRNNPVAAGLWATIKDWPWVIDPHA